jgi:hypothetical protein
MLTKGFQNCVGFQNLLLDPGGDVGSDRAQIFQDEFRRLRLSGAKLRLMDQFLGNRTRRGKFLSFTYMGAYNLLGPML